MLSKNEAEVLRLILFRRGMRPGASLEELERAVGDGVEDSLRSLNDVLGELGLEIVVVDESDELLGGERKRAFVRSKPPLQRQDIKLCGFDRRQLAALAVTSSFLANRGGRAKELELVNLLKTKRISPRKIDRLIEAGYLSRDDDMVSLSWRTLAEVDLDQLKRLFISAKPPKPKN
jgi:hypothetical protein